LEVLNNEYIRDISKSKRMYVDKEAKEPSFLRDVCPYFLPTVLLVWYFFTLVYF
jgi:hypothetical protein